MSMVVGAFWKSFKAAIILTFHNFLVLESKNLTSVVLELHKVSNLRILRL